MACKHNLVRHTWSTEGGRPRWTAMHCASCDARLSLGPSNDDIPLSEVLVASCAHSDADLDRYDNEGAFDWDPSRPLAYQWPWNGFPTREASEAHNAAGDAQIEALIAEQTRHDVAASVARHDAFAPFSQDPMEAFGSGGPMFANRRIEGMAVPARETAPDAFAPVDTASIEPWCASPETQLSDACDAVNGALDEAETKVRELAGALVDLAQVESEYAETIGAVKLLSALAEPSPGWEERVEYAIDEKFDSTDGEL